MSQHQVLKVPVRALRSTLVGNSLITGTSLTTRRIPGRPVTPPSRRNLGDSFLTRVGVEDVGVEVVTPPFSLSPPAHNSSNDNYCVEAPQTKDFVEDQKLRDLTQNVNLNVVCHVQCATGPSQRKDISPFQLQKKNKICQACLLCRSLPLCPTCQQCPACCRKSSCGRTSATFLAGLALPGCESKGGIHTERRLLTALQDKTTPVKVTSHCQPLLRSSQKQTSEGILTGLDPKTSRRTCVHPFLPCVLQPVISGSKTQQQVEAHSRPQSTEFVPSVSLLQNGNPREHQTLPSERGVLDFSDAYFHVPISPRSRKYLRFHLNGRTYQFSALPFGLSTAPLEFTKVVKEVKLMAQSQGIRIHQYLNDWLVRAPCREMCKRHTQTSWTYVAD